jgi:hypothetical protein
MKGGLRGWRRDRFSCLRPIFPRVAQTLIFMSALH